MPTNDHPGDTDLTNDWVTLPDHRTGVTRLGEGTPVVLVHSLGLDRHLWDAAAHRLREAGWQTITYDVRGHGTAEEATPASSVAQLGDDLATLLDQLEIPSCAVVGTSMGMAIALEFAASHPERVTGLGLVAGIHVAFPALRERAEAGLEHGLEPLREPTLKRWFGAARLKDGSQVVAYARATLAEFRLDHWVASWTALAELNVTDRIDRLTMPTVIVAGEDDSSTSPAVMTKVVEAIPSAERLDVVPGGPHLVAATHPDKVAQLLTQLPH